MYPFGTCELSMNRGYVKMTPKKAEWSTIVFDTVPKEMYTNDWTHKYLSFMICSDTAAKGRVMLSDLGGKRQKIVDVEFTAEWQRIIIDLSDVQGWYKKDEDGNFTVPADVSPYSPEGNSFYGGFKFSLSGSSVCRSYHFDYFGLFADRSAAESYSVLANEGDDYKSTLMNEDE